MRLERRQEMAVTVKGLTGDLNPDPCGSCPWNRSPHCRGKECISPNRLSTGGRAAEGTDITYYCEETFAPTTPGLRIAATF